MGSRVSIVGAFGVLFYLNDERFMATAFCAFLVLNVIAWTYLRRTTKLLVDASAAEYRRAGDVGAEIQTLLFREYMFGSWQWRRFGLGALFFGLLLALGFDVLPLPPGMTPALSFALAMALTVVSLEAWMWRRRLAMRVQREGLDWLEQRGYLRTEGADRRLNTSTS